MLCLLLKTFKHFLFVECKKGYMRGTTNSGYCIECPTGTYSDSLDVTSCTSCPEGLSTKQIGTDDSSLCFGK